MSRENDLEPLGETIDEVFNKMGLPDPVLMSHINAEWENLAGSPWVGRSTPLYVRDEILVVEAAAPSMVAFLRYGAATLTENLKKRFGNKAISGVEVVPPGGE